MATPSMEQTLADIQASMSTVINKYNESQSKLTDLGTELQKNTENGAQVTQELKTRVDEALSKTNDLSEQVRDAVQKGLRASNAPPAATKTIGQQAMADEQIKVLCAKAASGGLTKNDAARYSGIQAAITSVETDTDGNAGVLIEPQKLPGILGLPRTPLSIRDLVPSVTTTSNTIRYVEQIGRTNNAAIVPETTKKPESSLKWIEREKSVVTMAHLFKASVQALADAPALQGEIDSEGRYMLSLKEEENLLYGAGTAGNVQGLYTAATAFANPAAAYTDFANPTGLDKLRLAVLQAALNKFPPTAMVMSLLNWTMLEMGKNPITGEYIFANPQNVAGKRLWNLPVVDSFAMTAGQFLVGNFPVAATIYDRQGMDVQISTENVDDFEKNMVTVRIEKRFQQIVKRPLALVKGTF